MCLENATCRIRKQRMLQPPLSSCPDSEPWGTHVETACPPSSRQPLQRPRARPEGPRDEEAQDTGSRRLRCRSREPSQGAQPQAFPKHRNPLNSWAEMSGNLLMSGRPDLFFNPLYSGLSFSSSEQSLTLSEKTPPRLEVFRKSSE